MFHGALDGRRRESTGAKKAIVGWTPGVGLRLGPQVVERGEPGDLDGLQYRIASKLFFSKLAGIVQGITDRKRAEEDRVGLEARLQQAEKMALVGRLAGAHNGATIRQKRCPRSRSPRSARPRRRECLSPRGRGARPMRA